MKQRKLSRRSFLETALAGGALAGTASLTITKDLFAQASGPIVIGHHCDLTGVISSWGYWHDKCAKAAVELINKGGGIAGRKVELATEDTESNPGARRPQAAQPDPARQCRVHRRLGAFRRHAGGAADRHRAQDALLLDRRSDRGDRLEGHALSRSAPAPTPIRSPPPACPGASRTSARCGSIIYADYAWGQSTNQESQAVHREGRRQGARPASRCRSTPRTSCPTSRRFRPTAEVVLPAFIGSLSVAFYTQAKAMGLDKKMKMFSSSASLESIDPGDIQGAAEGVYFFENFPRMLAHKNDEYHKEFNRLIGIDDVYCREIGGTRVMDKSHGWQCWEDMFAIKAAIETSGYKTRKDIEGAIQALEGMQMKNSLAHPQGDKIIRKEDHAGIIDCYISRVENGKFEVKRRIPKEDLAKNMPLRHNLSDDAGVTGTMRRRALAPPRLSFSGRRPHGRVSEGQGLCGACRAGLPRCSEDGRQGGCADRGGRARRRAADRVPGILRAGLSGLGLGAGADQEPRILQAVRRQVDRGAGPGGAAALRCRARARNLRLDRHQRALAGIGRLPVELEPADRRGRRDAQPSPQARSDVL